MLTIEPLTVAIGAEIGRVDLADDLADDTIAEIRAALIGWKVVFFRDQHALDRDRHVAFGRRFGELEVHPLTPPDQREPEIFVLPSGGESRAADERHSDVTWRPEPSFGSILRIVESPPLGGDTLWADMGAARRRCASDIRRSEHPVVRTHPDTGRKTIYVNGGFTCGIKGMDDAEARPLLDRLQRTATIPDVPCRFRWQPGSVAFWDNRATQHCVSNDFLPHRRVMERVTVAGDRPY